MDVTGYGMPFLSKLGLGFRYIKKWHSPAPYNRNFSPDELAEIVKEAGFVVEESILIGGNTKAVCLGGRKAMSKGVKNEGQKQKLMAETG